MWFLLFLSFFFTLCLPQKAVGGNSFSCQCQISLTGSLPSPLQNLYNHLMHWIMTHVAFPVFICNYSLPLFPNIALFLQGSSPCDDAFVIQTWGSFSTAASTSPLPQGNALSPLWTEEANNCPQTLPRSEFPHTDSWELTCITSTSLYDFFGSKPFLLHRVSLWQGGQQSSKQIPSQILGGYKWFRADLCQPKIWLHYVSEVLYSIALCCTWTQ